METLLLLVVVIVVLIRWYVLSERYREIERLIEVLRDGTRADVVGIRQRIGHLEEAVRELRGTRDDTVPVRAEGQSGREAQAVQAAPPALVPESVTPPQPLPIQTPPEPVFAEPKTAAQPIAPIPDHRRTRSSEEWETLVGGNWLNKAGIFVLVIAIALFLGYSFTQLGPAGRAGIGLAVSMALLAGGIVIELRAAYIVFARGLIAGGWAGLYFTTYAMQALDAAKVIRNPVLGAFLLLAVATGMVVHSLKYRAQAGAVLAYAVAFTTLLRCAYLAINSWAATEQLAKS
jgi:hypothetical protein